MPRDKLRHQIAREAARLLYYREEGEYYRARLRAARLVSREPVKSSDLPTNREIREELRDFVKSQAGGGFAEGLEDGPLMRLASELDESLDRFRLYRTLLAPLEQIRLNLKRHPEGDALYHSLQVFDLARDEYPYDEELLLAALLHEVGKAIDPEDEIRAGLAALDGSITPRTAWFIEHRPAARSIREGTLGLKPRRRLEQNEDYEELLFLSDCDLRGRVRGAQAPDIDQALAYLRDLATANGDAA